MTLDSFIDRQPGQLIQPIVRTYPTPYYIYSDFEIWTKTDKNDARGECLTANAEGRARIPPDPNYNDILGWRTIRVPLNTTLYSAYPGGQNAAQAISSMSKDGFLDSGPFPSDFHEYLKSDTQLYSRHPEVKRCYTAWMSGAPSIKVRVSILTATERSTSKSAGIYTGSKNGDTAPKTANPVQPGPKASPLPTIKAPPRSTMPVVHPTSAESDGTMSNVSPEPQPLQGKASPSIPQENLGVKSPSAASKPKLEPAPPGSNRPESPDSRPESNSEPEPTLLDLNQPKLPGSKPKSNSDSRPLGLAPEPASSPMSDIPPPIAIALNQPKPQPPIIQVEGVSYTADSAFNYVIGSKTLTPGGSPVVVNNVRYSLAPSATALFAGTRSIALQPGQSSLPVLTIENEIYTADSDSRAIIGSQTIVAGGPTVIIDNTPYYLAASPTPNLSEPYEAPLLTIGGQTYKSGPSENYIIDGQTLKPGGPPITVGGVDYALAPSAEGLISGGSTITLSSPQPQPPNLLTIGETVYTEDSNSNFVVGSQTLVPGGSPITINQTPYSLISAPSGIALIIGFKTSYLSPMTTKAALINIGGSVYAANAASEFIVGSQTLVPGGNAITINHTPYSLFMGPSGEALVIGSSTSFLGPTTTAFHTPAVITIGSALYTANANSEFIIGTQTLSPGHAITVSGTRISLGAQETDVVVGTSTEAINLANFIIQGFGHAAAPTTTSTTTGAGGSAQVAVFTGGANKAWGGPKGGKVARRVYEMIVITIITRILL